MWVYDPEALWGQETKHQRAFSPVGMGEVPKWQPLKDRYSAEELQTEEADLQVRITPQEDDSGEPISPRLQRQEPPIKEEQDD